MNTDPMETKIQRQSPARPISRRDRAINTDPPVKVRTAHHGTSTVKISTFAKGTSTAMTMSDLVSKDELDARVQEAIFKTEEEIMGCPLLQKAMAKVEEEVCQYTLGQISLLRTVSVCNKTTLISNSVGGAGEWPYTCTLGLGTFLLGTLTLSMPTSK